MTTKTTRIGLIGARGYVGAELLGLMAGHPHLELGCASSRALAGQPISETVPAVAGTAADGTFEHLTPGDVGSRDIDVWVLALPNGMSEPWVAAVDERSPEAVIVDLSSDHRFDGDWTYGLPELKRNALVGAKRVANPGCYATGAQLALSPIVDHLAETPSIFGVSGYSGAGTTPSPKNDPDVLRDNLVPYKLTGHTHELEIRWQLQTDAFFVPHVAPFFRGITLTITARVDRLVGRSALLARYVERYAHEPLVDVVDSIPVVADARHRHHATIGGFGHSATERHVTVVCTLDNLLKGAATQALQNINLTCGHDELAGIRPLLSV